MSAARHTPGLLQKFHCGCEARAGMESISLTPCPAHEAAPELLEAARLRVAKGCNDTCSNALDPSLACDCGHRALVAAIAKAEVRS